MKKFYVEDFDVAQAMYHEIEKENKEEVTFVGFYEDALAVIKELLMMYDEVMPHSIEIHPEELDWYDKEYYVTLDENFELWVEPAFSKDHDRYLMGYADVLFMMGDCNSAILNEMECDLAVELVCDDDEEECDECCGECCCHMEHTSECKDEECEAHLSPCDNSVTTRVAVDEDGRIHGFERTW